ncbi:MAG: SRPBCC family protein, partial [Actinomycetota bacterium]
VWKAMTTPELVMKWWGPRDIPLTSCEIDLRVGGAWRYVSQAPDGSIHPFKGVYREITPTERLSYTWIYDVEPISQYEAVETVSLHEHDGRTTATTLMVHPSKEARDGHINAGMERGMRETLDRLAELLATMQ